MPAFRAIFDRRSLVPPVALLAVLFGAWSALRLSSVPRADVHLIGLLMLTALASTFAAIIWGAVPHKMVPHARTWFGVIPLVVAGAIWLAFLAWDSHALGAATVLKLVLLLTCWLAMCTGVAALLRTFGAGVAVIVPATVAMVFLAFPATVVPLQRALYRPGAAGADRTVAALAQGCPILGMLDAIRQDAPFSWPEGTANRVMYRLTTLGQDAVWPEVLWQSEARLYAFIAADAAVLALLIPRRKQPQADPAGALPQRRK